MTTPWTDDEPPALLCSDAALEAAHGNPEALRLVRHACDVQARRSAEDAAHFLRLAVVCLGLSGALFALALLICRVFGS